MKLRQKLAAVLATAMIVTSVPVVTMAESTNKLTTVVKVCEDAELTGTTAPAIRIDLEDYDATSSTGEAFYLKLDNAKWLAAVDSTVSGLPSGVTATIISEEEMKVVVAPGTLSLSEIKIPLHVQVKTGDAKVSIINKGATTVTAETFVFATTSDKLAEVSVDDTIPSFYKSGEIADIILEEVYQGAFNAAGTNEIELTIQNSDFDFDGVGSLVLEYGFANASNSGVVSISDVAAIQSDKQVLKITLPSGLTADSIGQLRIKGIKVKSNVKTPEMGELTIDITGDSITEKRDVVVGKIAEYGNKLTVKDGEAVEIVSGQSEEVEFTLEENIEDSMTAGREVEFKLDKGYFALEAEDEDDAVSKENLLAQIKSIKNDNTVVRAADYIEDVIVEDEKVVGFTMKLPATAEIDEFKFKANVFMGLEESGEVTLSVSGRGIGQELSTVIVNAKKSIDVTSEAAVLKVGLKGQEAGKITITETEKQMIKKGNIEILLPNENGIVFAEEPEVKVNGDLKVDDAKIEDVKENGKVIGKKVVIPVTRVSKTASTIEISNFAIDTDRTVAEGSYDVEIGGNALTANDDTITAEDFIKIATANTEDLMGANGLAKGTSTFVIGENKYTINGVEKEMDAQSYIQNPGYTMVPVRYVAEAFGIGGNDIMFSKGTATIFAGNRTIQLTNNSDIAVVNGVQVKLATKVVMKDGRTYAPIGEVAQLLGVSKSWNNETKTATFTNK